MEITLVTVVFARQSIAHVYPEDVSGTSIVSPKKRSPSDWKSDANAKKAISGSLLPGSPFL
jgi:hypothetical protein